MIFKSFNNRGDETYRSSLFTIMQSLIASDEVTWFTTMTCAYISASILGGWPIVFVSYLIGY